MTAPTPGPDRKQGSRGSRGTFFLLPLVDWEAGGRSFCFLWSTEDDPTNSDVGRQTSDVGLSCILLRSLKTAKGDGSLGAFLTMTRSHQNNEMRFRIVGAASAAQNS